MGALAHLDAHTHSSNMPTAALLHNPARSISSDRNRGKAPRAHTSTIVRGAIRNGLFEDTESHKEGHLEHSPTDHTPRRTERAVLLELVDYAGKDGRMYPSIERLAADLEMGERTVRRAIQCLAARGILLAEIKGGKWSVERKRFAGSTVFRLNKQMVERYFGMSAPQPVNLTDEPVKTNTLTNTPLSTTTVCSGESREMGRGVDSFREEGGERKKQDRAGKPILPAQLYKQGRPTRYRHKREDVLAAMRGAGCTPERAAAWFKYARPDAKTDRYAPRFNFLTIQQDAADWLAREIKPTSEAGMTWAEMKSHAEKNRLTIVADYTQGEDGLWRCKHKRDR